jgi:hypothetical protein
MDHNFLGAQVTILSWIIRFFGFCRPKHNSLHHPRPFTIQSKSERRATDYGLWIKWNVDHYSHSFFLNHQKIAAVITNMASHVAG